VIFGEGVTNDAVGIILFDTVVKYFGPGKEVTASTPFMMGWGIIYLCVASTIVGLLIS
jgi:NhaP-type Na+/H+ or K+/H+ antiporter